MILKVLFILLALQAHRSSTAEELKCTRDFRKIGCFVRNLNLIPHLLVTNVDSSHENFTRKIDWKNYAGSLHKLACKCREKARGHYKYFGIGMYGECSGGNDNAALEKLFKDPTKSPLSCVNGEHKNCDVDDAGECAGTEQNDFFYEMIEGDCAAKIGKGDVFTAFPKQEEIMKNKLLTTFPKVGTVYEISFEVYPTSFTTGWASVLHMTVAGNYGMYGERIPGIWFHPSSTSAKTNKITICNALNGAVNKCYDSEALPLKKWINIKIIQAKYTDYEYTIYVNDKRIIHTTNTRPTSFDNVKVYAGDPWYNPQPGFIRNLKIAENCYDEAIGDKGSKLSSPKEIALKRSTLIGEISELCKEYQVSFDVKPTAYASGWHSVLHLTLGGNYILYGDRSPGVWFTPSSTSAATNALHICGPISRQRNQCYGTQQFPKNQWISVKVSQDLVGAFYHYRIHINGKEVVKVTNTLPMDFYDLKLYAADPWYPAQAGSIRNINVDGECRYKVPNVGAMKNLMTSQTSIVKNKLITTLTKLGKEYEISFDVYPTSFQSGWASVLHLTVSGDHGIYGERIPGIWFSPSTTSATTNTIHICNAISGYVNYCFTSKALPLKKWVNVKISQMNVNSEYVYRIFLDGEPVYKVVNTRPVTFDNVNVYAGDPWYATQAGYIRNLIIPESCLQKAPITSKLSIPAVTVLKKGVWVGILSRLCKEYEISLEVKATSFAAGWHSVFHVTLGGDYTVYGDRHPGIWFHPSSARATTNLLHICSSISRNKNSCVNTEQLPKNEWIKIVIGQFMSRGDYYYSVDINGKRVHMVKNTLPMVFNDLVVYAGDPWYSSQAGSIRNLQIDGGKC